MGTFSSKEAQAPPVATKMSERKIKDLGGNCPINHEARITHTEVPANRQRAISGCFGSSNMQHSLTGANRSQIKNPGNEKPQSRKMTEIRTSAYQNGVNRALKPKGGTWLYTLK